MAVEPASPRLTCKRLCYRLVMLLLSSFDGRYTVTLSGML